ncbi:MAG: hypothetical protein HKM05_10945 [Spirochaetales bacterium]|nr:hypothetical protein [Spirochaetales bacterium]
MLPFHQDYPDNVDGVSDVDVITGTFESNPAIIPEKLQFAVPGDVMEYSDSHIGYVLSNDETGTISGIQLIESTHWSALSISSVTNKRTLANLINGAAWIIARLK